MRSKVQQLYVEGIHPRLRSVHCAFDDFCREHNILYRIHKDDFGHQEYEVDLTEEEIDALSRYMLEIMEPDQHMALRFSNMINEGKTRFDFTLKENFDIGSNPEVLALVADYMGRDAEHLQSVRVPVKQLNVGDLMNSHRTHTKLTSVEPVRARYAKKWGSLSPIVVDSSYEEFPPALVVDGFKRLRGSHEDEVGEIGAIDIVDILAALGVVEDQYKSPTSRHTLKQSGFRSSFEPSKSFGGISTKLPRDKR